MIDGAISPYIEGEVALFDRRITADDGRGMLRARRSGLHRFAANRLSRRSRVSVERRLRDTLRPLIERGHVVESPHPTDRRATLLTLTPAGQETFARGVPAFRQFLASLDEEPEGKLAELERAVWTVRVALERLAAR